MESSTTADKVANPAATAAKPVGLNFILICVFIDMLGVGPGGAGIAGAGRRICRWPRHAGALVRHSRHRVRSVPVFMHAASRRAVRQNRPASSDVVFDGRHGDQFFLDRTRHQSCDAVHRSGHWWHVLGQHVGGERVCIGRDHAGESRESVWQNRRVFWTRIHFRPRHRGAVR